MVVTLNSKIEVQQLSSEFGGDLERVTRWFPKTPRVVLQDNGRPLPLEDEYAGNLYYALILARDELEDGETILIDSTVTADATGTFLACLFCKLGFSARRALRIATEAGCTPKREEQLALIKEIESEPDFGTLGLQIGDTLEGPNGARAEVGTGRGGRMVEMIDPPAGGLFSLLYATKRILGVRVDSYAEALRLWNHNGKPLRE